MPTRRRPGVRGPVDVCRIEVVACGELAVRVGALLRTGWTVLIEGRLHRRRGAQAGASRGTQEVIAERIQILSRPRVPAAGASTPRDACPA